MSSQTSNNARGANNQVADEWVMETSLPVSFLIKNVTGLFERQNADILSSGNQGEGARRLIVIEREICQYYLDEVVDYFEFHKVDYHIVTLDVSEEKKNKEALFALLTEMEQFGVLRRSEPLIAIGGGVLLDIAGLAANLYRRGIPYIRVPTTLVGLIDASVGAKTGINFLERRNRLGSYYPPAVAYLDKNFLKTLPLLEITSGLGEILKMAVIKDAALFAILEKDGEQLLETRFLGCDSADEVINRAVTGMKDELQDNLWEKNLERCVDFGHSFSPIIEMRSINQDDIESLTHGQAVALDVMFSSIISNQRSLLSEADLHKVFQTANKLKLPTYHALYTEPLILLEALQDTMRHRNGNQNLPIPTEIGQYCFFNDVSFDEIKAAVEVFKHINRTLFGRG